MSQDNKNSNSPSNSSTPNAEEQGKQQGKIVKQGILWKEGGVIKSWKSRFFVLADGTLSYYANHGATQKGKFHIAGCEMMEASERNIPFCFKIKTAKRTLYLRASNSKEMFEWIDAIRDDGAIETLPDVPNPVVNEKKTRPIIISSESESDSQEKAKKKLRRRLKKKIKKEAEAKGMDVANASPSQDNEVKSEEESDDGTGSASQNSSEDYSSSSAHSGSDKSDSEGDSVAEYTTNSESESDGDITHKTKKKIQDFERFEDKTSSKEEKELFDMLRNNKPQLSPGVEAQLKREEVLSRVKESEEEKDKKRQEQARIEAEKRAEAEKNFDDFEKSNIFSFFAQETEGKSGAVGAGAEKFTIVPQEDSFLQNIIDQQQQLNPAPKQDEKNKSPKDKSSAPKKDNDNSGSKITTNSILGYEQSKINYLNKVFDDITILGGEKAFKEAAISNSAGKNKKAAQNAAGKEITMEQKDIDKIQLQIQFEKQKTIEKTVNLLYNEEEEEFGFAVEYDVISAAQSPKTDVRNMIPEIGTPQTISKDVSDQVIKEGHEIMKYETNGAGLRIIGDDLNNNQNSKPTPSDGSEKEDKNEIYNTGSADSDDEFGNKFLIKKPKNEKIKQTSTSGDDTPWVVKIYDLFFNLFKRYKEYSIIFALLLVIAYIATFFGIASKFTSRFYFSKAFSMQYDLFAAEFIDYLVESFEYLLTMPGNGVLFMISAMECAITNTNSMLVQFYTKDISILFTAGYLGRVIQMGIYYTLPYTIIFVSLGLGIVLFYYPFVMVKTFEVNPLSRVSKIYYGRILTFPFTLLWSIVESVLISSLKIWEWFFVTIIGYSIFLCFIILTISMGKDSEFFSTASPLSIVFGKAFGYFGINTGTFFATTISFLLGALIFMLPKFRNQNKILHFEQDVQTVTRYTMITLALFLINGSSWLVHFVHDLYWLRYNFISIQFSVLIQNFPVFWLLRFGGLFNSIALVLFSRFVKRKNYYQVTRIYWQSFINILLMFLICIVLAIIGFGDVVLHFFVIENPEIPPADQNDLVFAKELLQNGWKYVWIYVPLQLTAQYYQCLFFAFENYSIPIFVNLMLSLLVILPACCITSFGFNSFNGFWYGGIASSFIAIGIYATLTHVYLLPHLYDQRKDINNANDAGREGGDSTAVLKVASRESEI